jgi:hypothetical protein
LPWTLIWQNYIKLLDDYKELKTGISRCTRGNSAQNGLRRWETTACAARGDKKEEIRMISTIIVQLTEQLGTLVTALGLLAAGLF